MLTLFVVSRWFEWGKGITNNAWAISSLLFECNHCFSRSALYLSRSLSPFPARIFIRLRSKLTYRCCCCCYCCCCCCCRRWVHLFSLIFGGQRLTVTWGGLLTHCELFTLHSVEGNSLLPEAQTIPPLPYLHSCPSRAIACVEFQPLPASLRAG